jgi:PTS system mannose-specific IID component
MVNGGLISHTFVFSTKIVFNIGQVPFDLQANLFDAIMPNLLPLGLTC